jgi:hypothetical protein
MTDPVQMDPLKAALQDPLPLRPDPLMGDTFATTDDADRYAIYTEPADAPGRDEVYDALRAGLRAEQGKARPKAVGHIDGETLGAEDWEPGFAYESDWDSDEICGQVLFYRLVLTRDLAPIGFCSFEVNVDETGIVAVTLVEAWISSAYRELGLAAGFVIQMAEAVWAAIDELDTRVSANGDDAAAELGILISRETPSATAEPMLPALAAALKTLIAEQGETPLQAIAITAVNVA